MDDYVESFNESFDILSTIRFDPNLSLVPPVTYDDISKENFFLLPQHVQRLKFSLEYFTKVDFEIEEDYVFHKLIDSFKSLGKLVYVPYKIRGLFSLNGDCKFEFHEVVSKSLFEGLNESRIDEVWDVYINTEPTLVSPFTSFKTTKRDHYNRARELLPGKRPGKEEVILFNSQENLMEGSITNVAVDRDGRWVTPMLSSGCLCGVTRSYLLRENLIEEDIIQMDTLKSGDKVLLFNAIMGVERGIIQ